ncbi:hypothetical protein HN460_01315 [bacterium]|jgi:hypothetical protein|nr:hypothetical protein [bacterium]MBT3795862.1 hypothetical protein [bacterium]MBT4634340.1 hypothetical protein [bacterium]
MKKLNNIFILFSLSFALFLAMPLLYGNAQNEENEAELRANINKVNLSKIQVTDFRWKHKAKSTIGVFEYIEVANNSNLTYKNLKLEIIIYSQNGSPYKFQISLPGDIGPNSKKRFSSVSSIMLSFSPEKTLINIESAKVAYDKDTIRIKAKNAIKVNEFKYIPDSIATKTIQVKKLSYTNNSKNFFKDIIFSVNFLDQKGKLLKAITFKDRLVIGPGETKISKEFQIPGLNLNYFSDINLTVYDGTLIGGSEYLSKGGDSRLASKVQSTSFDSPYPKEDLIIESFDILNKNKNTMGLMNINLSNNSRYEYKDIALIVGFVNSSGSTTTSKKIKIKDTINPYSSRLFSSVNFGIIDNNFDTISLSISSAEMISSVQEINRDDSIKKESKLKENVDVPEGNDNLVAFDSNDELLILNVDIARLASVKVLNISSHVIFDPIFNLILLNKDNEVVKTLLLKGSGKINPKEERTYRSININNINSYNYDQYRVEFVSGQKVK